MKLLLVPLVLCLGLVKAQPDPIPVPSTNPLFNFTALGLGIGDAMNTIQSLPQLSLVNNALGDQLADLEVKAGALSDAIASIVLTVTGPLPIGPKGDQGAPGAAGSQGCPKQIGSARSSCSAVLPYGCYCIVRLKRTLDNAKTYCNAFGMNLVSIESAAEQTRVAFFLARLKNWYSSTFWTAGSRKYFAPLSSGPGSYQWVWGGQSAPMSYTSWADAHPTSRPGANYVTIDFAAPFGWIDDVNLDSNGNPVARYFICEY